MEDKISGLEKRLSQLHGTVGDVLGVVERGTQDTRLQRCERQLDRLAKVISALCKHVGFSDGPLPIGKPTAMANLMAMAIDPVRSNTAASGQDGLSPPPITTDTATGSEGSTDASAVPAPTVKLIHPTPHNSQDDAPSLASPPTTSTLLSPSQTATEGDRCQLPSVNTASDDKTPDVAAELSIAASSTSLGAPIAAARDQASPTSTALTVEAPSVEAPVGPNIAPFLPATSLVAPITATIDQAAPCSGESLDPASSVVAAPLFVAPIPPVSPTASVPEAPSILPPIRPVLPTASVFARQPRSRRPTPSPAAPGTLERLGLVTRSRSSSVSPPPGTTSGKRKPTDDSEDQAAIKRQRL
jgi:hypothetical protein